MNQNFSRLLSGFQELAENQPCHSEAKRGILPVHGDSSRRKKIMKVSRKNNLTRKKNLKVFKTFRFFGGQRVRFFIKS